jgi:DNA repair exonuclease SbcCD ATPase subunit
VASRANKPIDLFIADEIDHALDESGLERLMGVLEEKSRTKGTVLVISHNSLSDWIRQSVTVIKSGGRSTLDGEALACR